MRQQRQIPHALAGILAAVMLALPLAAPPVRADDAAATAPAVTLQNQEALDPLFASLRVAPDAETAHRLEAQIWTIWLSPSDPWLRTMMHAALGVEQRGNAAEAIQLLDQVVAAYPGYAEGWNQRATLYYMMGDYQDSLADCARVLALEPRHFGALSGRALIHLAQGDRDAALGDIRAALAVDPFLAERQLFPELPQQPARQI